MADPPRRDDQQSESRDGWAQSETRDSRPDLQGLSRTAAGPPSISADSDPADPSPPEAGKGQKTDRPIDHQFCIRQCPDGQKIVAASDATAWVPRVRDDKDM